MQRPPAAGRPLTTVPAATRTPGGHNASTAGSASAEGDSAQLAETMGVTLGRVPQIERGELSTIEAIARYVQALGGRLELVANFAGHTLTVTTTEAA